MPTNDQRDFAYLQAAAREARAKDVPYLSHLNQAIGIWNYIRIANDIAAQVPPQFARHLRYYLEQRY